MNRLQLRRPAGLRRRPLRARRLAVAHDAAVEYSRTAPTPRWVPVVAGVLGAAVTVQAVVGVAVLL